MEISDTYEPTWIGPDDLFTGTVYVDTIVTPSEGTRLSSAHVHFTPGARTVWHTHPCGQTIYVLDGIGRFQRRGGLVEVLRGGDSVFFPPGEDHWHGAAPDRFMAHVAMWEVGDDGKSAELGEPVAEEDYDPPLRR
jgi:quercetin dioxygenase-like cupin family protein